MLKVSFASCIAAIILITTILFLVEKYINLNKEGLTPNPSSPLYKLNEKCKDITNWGKCANLDNDADLHQNIGGEKISKCGLCENPNSQKYYYSDSENVVTKNQTWNPYGKNSLLFKKNDSKVSPYCSDSIDKWHNPEKEIVLFNKVGTGLESEKANIGSGNECRKRIEQELCAKANKCDHLGENVSDFEVNAGGAKKYTGLGDDWVKNNCGFCPAGKIKGIPIVEHDGKLVPKYKDDVLENGCGGYEDENGKIVTSPISYIRYENNPNISLNDNEQMWNKGDSCNDITGQNPCFGTLRDDWGKENGCYDYLFKTYGKGLRRQRDRGDPDIEHCTSVVNKNNFLNENDIIGKGWMALNSFLPIQNAMKKMQDKINSKVFTEAKKYSEYCWGSSEKNPCHPHYVAADGTYPDECKDIVYNKGEKGYVEPFVSRGGKTEKETNRKIIEGFPGKIPNYQCTQSGYMNYGVLRDLQVSKFRDLISFAAPFIRSAKNNIPNFDVAENSMINYTDLKNAFLKQINIESAPQLNHVYYKVLSGINKLDTNDNMAIYDLKNTSDVEKFAVKQGARLACKGTKLDAKKYFPAELPSCWEDFVVKMIISAKYKLERQNKKLILKRVEVKGEWSKNGLNYLDFKDEIRQEQVFENDGKTLRSSFPWWLYIHLYRIVDKETLKNWFKKTFKKVKSVSDDFYIIYDRGGEAYKMRNAFSLVSYKNYLLKGNANKNMTSNNSLKEIYTSLASMKSPKIKDFNKKKTKLEKLGNGDSLENMKIAYSLAREEGFFNSHPDMVHYIRNDLVVPEQGYYFIPERKVDTIADECMRTNGDCLIMAFVKIANNIEYRE